MITKRFRVCSLFGTPVYVDFTFLVVCLFVSDLGVAGALAAAAALGASIVAHELGHSLAAKAYGCGTADITLSLLGGRASLTRLPGTAVGEIVVALAGPAVSFALASAALAACVLFRGTCFETAYRFAFAVNFMLFTFNLLPGFPMDGGRVLRGFLELAGMYKAKATWYAVKVGKAVAVGIAAYGVVRCACGNFGGVTCLLIAFFIHKAGDAELMSSRLDV